MARKRTSPIWLCQKEEFENLVKKSTTVTEVLRYFDLKNKGYNYRTVYARVEEDGLDISHFNSDETKKKKLRMMNDKARTPLEEILVENSTYNRTHLKNRLIEENIIPYECRNCGNEGEWNGKPLSLQLEHINGISDDNRVENLCFLCPNCHSQTDTYAGRRNKIALECMKCERAISRHSKTGLCKSCGQKDREDYKAKSKDRPSLDSLKKDIEELGYRGTGRKYGVSDNAVRKWIMNT